MPLHGQIVVDQLFSGAVQAAIPILKREQRGIANENRCIGALEHLVEIGGQWKEGNVGIAPAVKKDARVSEGGAAGGVRGNGAELLQRLMRAAHQQQ
jgi:hypothetical protein